MVDSLMPMDTLTSVQRSKLMGRVRSKNTSIELKIRKLLFGLGFRYRLHDPRLPGRPDIVFAGRRKVVFVNGCFWHGHNGCRLAKLPKTNYDFWCLKINRNIMRDRENISALEAAGWKVFVVWQCELKDFESLAKKITYFLNEA